MSPTNETSNELQSRYFKSTRQGSREEFETATKRHTADPPSDETIRHLAATLNEAKPIWHGTDCSSPHDDLYFFKEELSRDECTVSDLEHWLTAHGLPPRRARRIGRRYELIQVDLHDAYDADESRRKRLNVRGHYETDDPLDQCRYDTLHIPIATVRIAEDARGLREEILEVLDGDVLPIRGAHIENKLAFVKSFGLSIVARDRIVTRKGFDREIKFDGKTKPWLLFLALVDGHGKAESRSYLREKLWEGKPVTDNALDQHKKTLDRLILPIELEVKPDNNGHWCLSEIRETEAGPLVKDRRTDRLSSNLAPTLPVGHS